MIARSLLAPIAIIAVASAGADPAAIVTSEAQAHSHAPPPPRASSPNRAKGKASKKRTARKTSTAASSAKVPATKKRASASKKQSRKATGKSAKSAVPASVAATVQSPAPLKGILKNGALSRASMTAVEGAKLNANAPSTANPGQTRRASLDVNTNSRSARSRTVKASSKGKNGANSRKKSTRRNRGRTAKSAVAPTRGVTFAGFTKVSAFDKNQPSTKLGRPRGEALNPSNDQRTPSNRSSVSEVLPRQPMPVQRQGLVRRFIGRVSSAFRVTS